MVIIAIFVLLSLLEIKQMQLLRLRVVVNPSRFSRGMFSQSALYMAASMHKFVSTRPVLLLGQFTDAAAGVGNGPLDFIDLVSSEEILFKCIMVDNLPYHPMHNEVKGTHLHAHMVEVFGIVIEEFALVTDSEVSEQMELIVSLQPSIRK